MSNTVTNLDKQLIADEILPALKLGLTPLQAMSFQAVADKPLYTGDIVKVDVVSAKSATTYSSTFATGDSSSVATDVTILAPSFSSWHINPYLEGDPTASRFLALGREAAYAVAKDIVQGVLENFVDTNIGSGAGDVSTIAAASFDSDDYADMLGKIRVKGVNGGVSAIMNVAYAAAIQKDAALKDASAYGNAGLIQTGELPNVLGVRNYFTDAFPTDLTNENVGVIFTGKTTAAVAVGAAGDPTGQEDEAGVRTVMVTDPDTGLSLTWRTWVNSDTGVHWGSVYAMYGTSYVQDAAVRIISA
jgi:hypothetical protein